MPRSSRDLPEAASLAEALSYFDSYLGFQQRLQRVPGIQAAVLAGGSIALSTALGQADVEHGVPLTTDHLFRVASHSKTYTATLVMRLAEAGSLRLDDTAAQWVDFLAGAPLCDVTIRELLAHSAGVVRDGADGDFWILSVLFPDRDELRAMLLDAGAAVVPRNDRFKYSNVGFSLLGLIAEAAAGAPYDELVQREILRPLGLARTGPDYEPERADEYVVGYSSLAYTETRAPVDQVPAHAFAPATGFYSTAEDLVSFFSAHCLGDERLLADESKRQMQHPLWPTGDDDEGYGLGLIATKAGDRDLVGHSGGWPGQSTKSVVDPRAGLAISVLTNTVDGPAAALAHAGVRLIDLAGAEPRPESTADLARFTGRFVNGFFVVDIAVLGGRLYWLTPTAPDPAKDAVPLELVDDHTLRSAGGSGYLSYGEPMTFTFGDDGRVTSMRSLAAMSFVPLESFVLPERFTLQKEVRMTDTAFVGATLIDGTGAAPRPDSAVLVRDGRFTWVGQAEALEPTPDLKIVDLAGKFVTPGLIDANVHLVIHIDPDVLLRYDPGWYDDLVLEAAQVALRAGYTTVFDTWGPLEALKRVRDRINTGEAVGSRMFIAGNIIGNGGPYSDDFFAFLAAGLSSAVIEEINKHWAQGSGAELTWMSAEDVRQAVREYIQTSGIDFVKYAGSSHAHSRFLAFSLDAQRAIVEEAHAAGMTAQACTQAPEPLKVAIEAGVDLLQHGDVTGLREMPEETLTLIAERQLPCVAFLYTQRHTQAFLEAKPQWHGNSGWGQVMVIKDANDRRLIRASAKLLLAADMSVYGPTAATSPMWGPFQNGIADVPTILGRSHIYWLRAAKEQGVDPMDALLATTRNVAEAYQRSDEIGTVEPGKHADLLVLDADPLADPDNYTRIAHVVKGGEIVDRDRLPENPVLTVGDDHPSVTPPTPTAEEEQP